MLRARAKVLGSCFSHGDPGQYMVGLKLISDAAALRNCGGLKRVKGY